MVLIPWPGYTHQTRTRDQHTHQGFWPHFTKLLFITLIFFFLFGNSFKHAENLQELNTEKFHPWNYLKINLWYYSAWHLSSYCVISKARNALAGTLYNCQNQERNWQHYFHGVADSIHVLSTVTIPCVGKNFSRRPRVALTCDSFFFCDSFLIPIHLESHPLLLWALKECPSSGDVSCS